MKILFYDKSNIYSGAEKSLVSLLNEMNSGDNMLLFNYPLDHHKYYDSTKIIYRNKKLKFWMGSDYSLKNIRGSDFFKRIIFAIQLFKILKKYKPDIFHINLYRDTDFLDLLVCKLCNVKSVAHVMSLRSQVNINPNVIKLADLIVSCSNFVNNEILSVKSDLNTITIYLPIDLQFNETINSHTISNWKKSIGLSDKTFIISSVAILDKRKGHDTAIRVAYEITKHTDDFVLLIAGGDFIKNKNEYERLSELVKELNIKSKVKFLGHVEAIELLYSSSDIILALSRDGEAFGRVPVEAAKYKKVTIGTKMGATPEVIIHEVTGFIINPGDIEAVTKNILYIKENKSIAIDMGEKSFKNLLNNFSSKTYCENILINYKELIKK